MRELVGEVKLSRPSLCSYFFLSSSSSSSSSSSPSSYRRCGLGVPGRVLHGVGLEEEEEEGAGGGGVESTAAAVRDADDEGEGEQVESGENITERMCTGGEEREERVSERMRRETGEAVAGVDVEEGVAVGVDVGVEVGEEWGYLTGLH